MSEEPAAIKDMGFYPGKASRANFEEPIIRFRNYGKRGVSAEDRVPAALAWRKYCRRSPC